MKTTVTKYVHGCLNCANEQVWSTNRCVFSSFFLNLIHLFLKDGTEILLILSKQTNKQTHVLRRIRGMQTKNCIFFVFIFVFISVIVRFILSGGSLSKHLLSNFSFFIMILGYFLQSNFIWDCQSLSVKNMTGLAVAWLLWRYLEGCCAIFQS